MLEDTPVNINGWKPHNYNNRYRGQMPLYMGLMLSSNVMAARLIKDVGVRSVIGIARSLGITTPIEYDMTIALGSNGVKLYEMTVAYGAFANGGFVVQPYSVERVETSRGKVVYKAPKTKISHQLSMNTAAEMTAMLKTVMSNGTGRAANIGKPAAGKTGTTDDNKDAYFVGYTPNIVTGVWVGNDDNTVMSKIVQGGTVPALIWRDVMKVATEPYGKAEFNYPEVQLIPFAAGSNVKIIGGDDNAEKPKEEEEKPVNLDDVTAVTPADVVKNANKKNAEQPVSAPVAPKPAAPAKPAAAPIPIPMAVPESLH